MDKVPLTNLTDDSEVFRNASVTGNTPPEVLISIQPDHARNIAEGYKTVEFRRRFPDEERVRDSILWIYSTSPEKAVIAAAKVEKVHRLPVPVLWATYAKQGCIDQSTFNSYFDGVSHGYAIELSDVRRPRESVEAGRLKQLGFTAPQSFRYVTDDVAAVLRESFGEEITSRHEHRDSA